MKIVLKTGSKIDLYHVMTDWHLSANGLWFCLNVSIRPWEKEYYFSLYPRLFWWKST